MEPTRTSRSTALIAACLALAFAPGAKADAPSRTAAATDPPPTAAPPPTPWKWPDRAKNLKVLPKRTPPEDLRAVMTGFTQALGVRCSHCHVGEEGRPLHTYDFPSDRNPKKQVARGMLEMVETIRKRLEKIQPDKEDRVEVGCHTCHHGRPIPRTLAEELSRAYTQAGADSALARYRALRSRYLEAGAYDFRERALNETAALALGRGDARGALALLRENLERFPGSSQVHERLGEAHLAAGDTASAVASYEKAIQLEPRNQQAKQILEKIRRGR